MKVTVYGKRGCGVCTAAKRYLADRGIHFEDVDVSGDSEALQEMVDRSGGAQTVPVIALGDQTVVGFDLERLNQILAGT